MAVAAPARRTAPAPGPSRTTPPPARKPARKAPSRSGRAAAPAKRAPARRAPARRAPKRSAAARLQAGGQLIPIAVGRTAVAFRDLPDSGLIVRMTRGRAWIAVLGLLLAGIVALNVITLSFAASAGRIDEQITTLAKENTRLEVREAQAFSADRIRKEAASLGLVASTEAEPQVIEARPDDVLVAAERLAAAGGG
ncbi:MAG: hypothetical protein R2725_13925 [Solirubrobacterales bacterium]